MGSLTLALLFLFIFPLCSAQRTYYVTPTPETPCPGEPCHTLSEYATQVGQYFTSNTAFVFLSGNHSLEKSVSIEEQTSLSLTGDSSPSAQVTSRIVCSQPASIYFYNISNLVITSLAFISCGKSVTGPAVMLNFAPHAKVMNCLFQNNTNMNPFDSIGGALAVIDSDPVDISENNFTGNNATVTHGGGIYLLNSTATLTRNSFTMNYCSGWGGGVYSQVSVVSITDSVFKDNTASFGGGVEANSNSSVTVIQSTFVNNTVGRWGGGADVYGNIQVNFTGNVFIDNSAESGGGISAANRVFMNNNTFAGNSANNRGGGVLVANGAYYIASGDVNFRENSFASNCAGFNGGGVFVDQQDSTSIVLTQNNFTNNCGRGWVVYVNSAHTATFTDNVFVNNTGSVLYGSFVQDKNNTTFYVKPTLETPCPNQLEICYTLSEYVQLMDQLFTTNTTLVFLPGNHTLENGILISNISSLTLIGSNPTIQETTTIICARPASFSFQEINELYITAIAFESCGDGSNAAVNLESIYFAEISTSTFQNSENTNRYGGNGGALAILDSYLVFFENKLINNIAIIGGGIYVYNSTAFFTQNNFKNNTASHAGGGVEVYNSNISCINAVLEENAAKYGGAMRARQAAISFNGTLRMLKNKAVYGAGIYAHSVGATVFFNGDTSFSNNMASYGGAIYAENSFLFFSGTTSFVANSALNGGGLLLSSDSTCYFQPETVVDFMGNSAKQTGGAIKVEDSNPLIYCPESSVLTDCFFQIVTESEIYSRSQIQGLDISISFENNTADKGGGDIHGGAIDTCNFYNIFSICFSFCDIKSSGDIFDTLTESKLDVASDPIRICYCNSNNNTCKDAQTSLNVAMYPGTTLHVPVLTLGQRDGPVPAAIQSDFSNSKIRFHDTERTQDTSDKCTDLHYTLLSASEQTQENVTLYAQGPCPRESRSLPISIDVLQCPHGFELHVIEETCVCHHRLKVFTDTCDIDKEAVLRPRGAVFWIGYNYENATQGLILHPHCPFDYCIRNESFIVVDNASEQCSHGRTGNLCGECMPGLSLVLGSTRCFQCSNIHLSLLVAFAFAGIALVLFIFTLKLTVAVGTINGLIFYANVVQVNAAIFLPPGSGNILTVFIAWLNLDLGIETCFYNGMDTYAKTWLQFVFPLYVWFLVGIIIFVSHYSQRIANLLGNNPIAVLATLFLLSYAKILRTITAALAVTYLEYPDGKRAVWLYDGSLNYFHSKHGPLILVAALFLVLIFLPYTFLLFLGQWIQVKSDWKIFSWINKPSIKIFLDAHHAPYADKHRYWTGLLLLLRFILFLIFILNALGEPSINLLSISSAAVGLFTIGFLTEKIYKSWYLSILEVSFILNLIILSLATYHVSLAGGSQAAVAYTSLGIAFATFVGIVIYHVYLQLENTKRWKRMNMKLRVSHMFTRKDYSSTVNNTESVNNSITTSSLELREPLLDEI